MHRLALLLFVSAAMAFGQAFPPAVPAMTGTKYTTSWATQTSVTVTHGLATTAVLVQVYDASGVLVVPESVTATSNSVVTLTFGAAFTGSVVVTGTKYTTNWTTQTSVTVTHGLGTTAVLVQVYDASGVLVVPESVTATSGTVVTLTFGAAFTGSVVVTG